MLMLGMHKSSIFAEVTVLISYVDRPALFCDSIDLIDNLESTTAFCKFSGEVLMLNSLPSGIVEIANPFIF